MKFDNLKPIYSGKVREIYDIGKYNGFDALLIVATDRISCFDYILPTLIPDKGKILTKMSNFWFKYVENIVPNHLIVAEPQDIPEEFRERSVIVKKAKRINIECVVRGYLSGSAWQEYKNSGIVCGIKLPSGLRESDKLPEPIFTPATKEEKGVHDRNISFEEMENIVGKDIAEKLRDYSLSIYEKATKYAEAKNIIIADTKFEFGLVDNQLILIDEVLTPDSSRFWDKLKYRSGQPQDSFDKQFVRDYLISIKWNKEPPVPELPEGIVKKTQEKYLEAYNRIVG